MSDYIVQVQKAYFPLGKDKSAELRGRPLTYSYHAPLRVGDRVMCPGNDYSGPFQAEVTQLGSDYDGHVKSLLCRVAPDRKRK